MYNLPHHPHYTQNCTPNSRNSTTPEAEKGNAIIYLILLPKGYRVWLRRGTEPSKARLACDSVGMNGDYLGKLFTSFGSPLNSVFIFLQSGSLHGSVLLVGLGVASSPLSGPPPALFPSPPPPPVLILMCTAVC